MAPHRAHQQVRSTKYGEGGARLGPMAQLAGAVETSSPDFGGVISPDAARGWATNSLYRARVWGGRLVDRCRDAAVRRPKKQRAPPAAPGPRRAPVSAGRARAGPACTGRSARGAVSPASVSSNAAYAGRARRSSRTRLARAASAPDARAFSRTSSVKPCGGVAEREQRSDCDDDAA